LSGCVEDPMQRRICLEQALLANPNNQAALDGMKVLDGELVPASEARPSLLDSRLSVIEADETVTGAPSPEIPPPPPPEAFATAPVAPTPVQAVGEPSAPVTGEKPRRRGIALLITVVFLLFLLVCALVVAFVLPPLLETF